MGFTYENAAEAALVAAGDVSLAADTLTSGVLSGLDSGNVGVRVYLLMPLSNSVWQFFGLGAMLHLSQPSVAEAYDDVLQAR